MSLLACGPGVAERHAGCRSAAYAYLLPLLLLLLDGLVVYSYSETWALVPPFSTTVQRHQIAVGPHRLHQA